MLGANSFLRNATRRCITQAQHRKLSNDASSKAKEEGKKGIFYDVHFWANAGAIAGWGMSGAAIYDAVMSGPENISLNMTGVLLVYSSLFARWAWIVQPRNTLLAACHMTNVVAQGNQMFRAIQHKKDQGKDEEVTEIVKKGAAVIATGGACVAFGPMVQSAIVAANLGGVSNVAGAAAGPFTVHFWAPMSKWLISGASFLDFDRPTELVSLPQYTALTATGFFFTRYALLVVPVNYLLCSVNIALFGSSFYHLSRKIKADYIDN
eukprot:CAMPEP_0195520692 /NCGR_PEP_ID=MMETSP0794_2-20130614/17438_1 /TAXON_ID=515487 /ORGANISM="Stephanopyxis turris, Strain CCMP 815" /LENGTH=264 /DNA_ID=CAMNT_0040650105 /DNA_START=65 /DNA_END=859 /DNA_ORIENTATION=-